MNGLNFLEISKPMKGYKNVSSVTSLASDYVCHPKQVISAFSPYSAPTLHLYTWRAKGGAALELIIFIDKSSGDSLVEWDRYSTCTLVSVPHQISKAGVLAGRGMNALPESKVGSPFCPSWAYREPCWESAGLRQQSRHEFATCTGWNYTLRHLTNQQ